ncbi:uncharacterized protein ARMOST_02966 [Armillaria ostoyae]|uniref:Uncharacterized protein n=1 Tax=Armillaria ostoyae TaxID=47428 RepID=A0A284QT51_ARMOS|nr:uncharacterized protein ARMOST_02966 [Armillaria ostoyae]
MPTTTIVASCRSPPVLLNCLPDKHGSAQHLHFEVLEFAALHEYMASFLIPSDFTSLYIFFASSFDSGEKIANDSKTMYWESVGTEEDEDCIPFD